MIAIVSFFVTAGFTILGWMIARAAKQSDFLGLIAGGAVGIALSKGLELLYRAITG